jgi:hypothetical protein
MKLSEQGPYQHADAKTVQNAKPDNHVCSGKVQRHHSESDGGANQTAGKNNQTPADRMVAKGDAYAGDQQKQQTAPVPNEYKGRGVLPIYQAVQLYHVVKQVNDHHSQDTDAPQNIQFPYPFFHQQTVPAFPKSIF